MKISVIQSDLIWEDRYQNFENLERLIVPLFGKTDIIVLPEMFNSGFSMKPETLSEPPSGDTFKWMKKMSESCSSGVCGSYIVKEDGHFFNRWVFLSPENESWHYDKRHLFSMGGENAVFTPGKSRLIFTFRGVRITPYICYDLRFPVWSRNRNNYDLMIYSANWPEVRINVWNTLLKARAIENQSYVVGSNRIGTDGNGMKYSGESQIIDPRGNIIEIAGTNEESVISAEISMSELIDFRNKFSVFNDADDFKINI